MSQGTGGPGGAQLASKYEALEESVEHNDKLDQSLPEEVGGELCLGRHNEEELYEGEHVAGVQQPDELPGGQLEPNLHAEDQTKQTQQTLLTSPEYYQDEQNCT